MKRAARYALVVIAILMAGCTAATVYRFSCDGKCTGEFKRDVETHDQPKKESK